MTKRILFITQWFEPEIHLKGLGFAKELVANGFEVEVITGFPNYPGGEVFPGYKISILKRQLMDGVFVTRVPIYPSHDNSALKRIANYFSFAISAFIYGAFFAQRPHIIYAYHPPLTVGLISCFIRMIRKIPIVYDIQDLWPDSVMASNMLRNKILLNFINKICNFVYNQVDRIVVLSPGFKEALISRGVPYNKISIIYNWCDDNVNTYYRLRNNMDHKPCEYFNIVYAGNIGIGQGLHSVLDAALLLQLRKEKICFTFIGSGLEVERLKIIVYEKAIKNVFFLPRCPITEIGGYLKNADALLVHLKKDALYEITIPSKTQAYMSIGKPILMGVSGDAAKLIDKAGCGVNAIPGYPLSIADAALTLSKLTKQELKEMGLNGKSYYKNNLSIKIGTMKFIEIFNDLL